MVLSTEESSSDSEPSSQAATATLPEGSTDEAPRSEMKQSSPVSLSHTSQSDLGGDIPSAIPLTTSKRSHRDSSLVQSVPEAKINTVSPGRALIPYSKWALGSPPGQGGSTPSGKAEKASVDGYNWRKYGQKNVKGNEFIRSYYKCTHAKCLVKKQVERSLEGQITDTVYFGQHEHPKPHINVPPAVELPASKFDEKTKIPSPRVIEAKVSEVLGQTCQQDKNTNTPLALVVASSSDVKSTALLSPRSRLRDDVDNDDDPSSKRKKKENHGPIAAVPEKATGESRLTIQMTSEVDIVSDGYRWRKYGQKLVKGNPNPRSYYRCSSPGCPAKKHVERSSLDPKVVMTTYEGQHDHNVPAARTLTRNPVGTNGATTLAQNDEARIKSEEENSNNPSKLTEQQNDKSRSNCDDKSKEQKKDEPSSPCKSHGEKNDPSDSVPENRLSEEHSNHQLTAKPEESEGLCLDKVAKKLNEQQQVLSTPAVVQS